MNHPDVVERFPLPETIPRFAMDGESPAVVHHRRVGSAEPALDSADAFQRLALATSVSQCLPDAQRLPVIREGGVRAAQVIVGDRDVVEHVGFPIPFTETPVEFNCLLPKLQAAFQTLARAQFVFRTRLLGQRARAVGESRAVWRFLSDRRAQDRGSQSQHESRCQDRDPASARPLFAWGPQITADHRLPHVHRLFPTASGLSD